MDKYLLKRKPPNSSSVQTDLGSDDGRPKLSSMSEEVDQEKSKKIKLDQPCTSKTQMVDSQVVFLDLSVSCDNGPKQPVVAFPRRNISGKQRSFQRSWYERCPWIEYSIKNDAVYCFVCRHFATQGQLLEDVLVKTGYSDWKHLGSMVTRHESSNVHKACLSKYHGWKSSKKTGVVTTKINDQLTKEIQKNRDILKSVIRSIIFCGRQNIALRGHRETELEDYEDRAENSDSSESGKEADSESNITTKRSDKGSSYLNKGNFKELLSLLCIENETLGKNIKSLPKNATYTSKMIQNDIILTTSKIITDKIISEIKEGSNVYSIIVDEARDEGHCEQMSVCCRYIHDSKVKERFLGFIQVHELNAQYLANKIREFFIDLQLDIENCVSQSFDGASVMSGEFNGLQALIRQLTKNPCPYIHCHAHRLNLVLVDVAKNVRTVDETIGLLEAIYSFQSSSVLRQEIFSFKKKTATGNKHLHVPQQCDTRWVSKYKGVHFFKTEFTSVVSSLKKCVASDKKKESAEAKGLLCQLTSFGNIIVLVCLDKILQCVNILSIQLQSSTIGIGKSLKLIEATMSRLLAFRTDDQFEECYEEAVKIANMNQIEVTGSASRSRTQKVSSRLDDYVTMETIGKDRSAANDADTEKTKMRANFFAILDNISNEMKRRFSENISFISAISACDPTSETFLNTEILCAAASSYGRDRDTICTIQTQCELGKTMFSSCKDPYSVYNEICSMGTCFKELKDLLATFLVIPVSTATAERSFSTMRRIKPHLRASMAGQRLSNLAIISIERELSYPLLMDPDPVVNEFAAKKGRRLQFVLK